MLLITFFKAVVLLKRTVVSRGVVGKVADYPLDGIYWSGQFKSLGKNKEGSKKWKERRKGGK